MVFFVVSWCLWYGVWGGLEEVVDYSYDPTEAYEVFSSPTHFVSSCTSTPLSLIGVIPVGFLMV